MYTKSIHVKIMIGSEVIKELCGSLLQKYQKNLEEKMRGSEIIFDAANTLYYDLNKISLNRGGSYIDSPLWLKNKKATINPKNNDDKCFRYAISVASNYQNIEKDAQRISKIMPYIDQYNWKDIDFPSHSKNWKTFESNNKSIALNILYAPRNTNHYLAVKSLSALLRGITSKHKEDFCLNCFHAYTTKNKLKKYKNVCENHDYCLAETPKEDNKILKCNHGEKSMIQPFVIYFESLLEKIDTYPKDLEKSSTTKISKHIPSGYSLFTCCLFDLKENRLDSYRGKDCMKKFCENLRERVLKIINYGKKK